MAEAGDQARLELGRHLRRARASLGWTLESLAERLDAEGTPLDPSTISRIEKGQITPALDTASGLARCLGTSVAALDEVLRSARRRKTVDITGRSFEKLMESGKREVSKGDIHAALDYFEAARDWVELHPEAPDRNDKLAQALIFEANAQIRLTNFILAHELVGRALNLATIASSSRLAALLTQVKIGYHTRDFARARAFAREAEPLLGQVEESQRAFAYAVLGDLHFMQGDDEAAAAWLEKARAIYLAIGDQREHCRTVITLGYALSRSGHRDNGLRLAREGLDAARRRNFTEVEVFGLFAVGKIMLTAGMKDGARAHLSRMLERSRSLGLANDEFLAYFYLWQWNKRFGTRSEASRCEKGMRRLLHRVDRDRFEVREYLAAMQEPAPRGRRRE